MVIGFDGSRAFASQRTGTENYSYQLLKHLLKIDTRNKYIVYTRKITKQWTAVQPNVIFKEIKLLRLWTQVGLAARTFIDPIDVLFVPAHTLPILMKPGLKTVMTVHDLGVEYLPKYHQLKQRLYLKNITRYQLTSATKLIAVSKATKEDLVKKIGIDGKKISVVYEGYDREIYNLQFTIYKKDALVKKRSLKTSDTEVYSLIPYFLFVGTIQPRKNLERIIKAFALVRSGSAPSLVIVGSKGWMSDEIYKLPKKLGIEERVKFLGYVPDKEMVRLYSGALALVFPSLFEGFGLPILEAQACGCPVLTSNISSMPEVAGKGAILVDPYSIDEIADGMINIMDEKIKEGLIKKGFENIKRFSWEKAARETLKVLESV